jgi:hypothetical protein
MSPGNPIGIICIASRCVSRGGDCSKDTGFAVENRASDTRDTKPSSRDTSTIHGITTMTDAGVFDVDFLAKTVP